jgi:hypothetical protein
MSLSCDYDWEPDPGDICWEFPKGFEPLSTKTTRKCCSCGHKISPGSPALRFRRWKIPEYDVELAIYGYDGDNGPPRAPWFHCLDCGNIALFLASPPLDYAFRIDDSMRELSREYAEQVKAGQAGCL